MPLCKKQKPLAEDYRKQIDPVACIFCLGSLYKDGYFHELCEKIPLIKKQSEEYGDDIAWRIGIRTRVRAHKKCYDHYINRFDAKEEDKSDTSSESLSTESSDLCGEERKSEEIIVDEIPPIKPYFCLKKFSPPPVGSGKF